MLLVTLDAVLDKGTQRLVVELQYEDPDLGYRFSHVKRITGAADVPEAVPIPLADRDRRTFSYQVSSVTADNAVHQALPVQATAQYLDLTPPP